MFEVAGGWRWCSGLGWGLVVGDYFMLFRCLSLTYLVDTLYIPVQYAMLIVPACRACLGVSATVGPPCNGVMVIYTFHERRIAGPSRSGNNGTLAFFSLRTPLCPMT